MRQLKITKQITNRENQSLDKYLVEISKLPMITAEMEVELAVRIRQGDSAALDKLTKANLRFVVSVAKQYQHKGLTLNDLINEGNVGLVKAASRFDETRGFKFISYAVWWIRQSILQALAEQSRVVRLPLNRVGTLNKMSRAFAELEQRFQRDPSSEELAALMGITVEEVELTERTVGKQVSVDAPRLNGEESTMLDFLQDHSEVAPDNGLETDSLKMDIRTALAGLQPREAEVLSDYYGLGGLAPKTLEEISEKFNLTRERVRQIKEKATLCLRTESRLRLLRTYLG